MLQNIEVTFKTNGNFRKYAMKAVSACGKPWTATRNDFDELKGKKETGFRNTNNIRGSLLRINSTARK